MIMAVGLIIAIGVNKKVWDSLWLIYVFTCDVYVNLCFQVFFHILLKI